MPEEELNGDTEVQDQDANDQAEDTAEDVSPETNQEEEKTEEKKDSKEEAKAEDKEEKPVAREVYSMPVSKAQEEKKRAVEKARKEAQDEYEAKMQKMQAEYEDKIRNAKPSEFKDKLDEVAEKHGLNKDAARELMEAMKESLKLPDTSKYDQILKEQEIASHKATVSKEFDEKVAPLILKDFPNATPEHIRKVKEQIGELAFTQGYNTYRIEDIYKVRNSDFAFKSGFSAESPGGRTSDIASFKKLSDEDEIKLADRDPVAYKKYLKWLEGQESKFID